MSLANLRAVWNPGMYHYHGKTRGFFEGWYYKLVDESRAHRFAIIPGVFYAESNHTADHAFVQVLDGMNKTATYTRYPVEWFHASGHKFDFWVGPNHFTGHSIELAIDSAEQGVFGALQFGGCEPWPVSILSPGIMGPFALLPFMECYHGVLSFDHAIDGALTIDGESIDFTDGRGYMEKDWGQAFPRAWIWMQSNHFEQKHTSLTVSVAAIPWLSGAFTGFIVGFLHEGRLYRFASYTGARIEHLSVTGDHVNVHFAGKTQGRRYRLEIAANRDEGGMLRSPERADMVARVNESMTNTINLRLILAEEALSPVVLKMRGECASLEVTGNMDILQRHL